MRHHSWATASLMLLSIAALWFLLRLAALDPTPALAKEPVPAPGAGEAIAPIAPGAHGDR